LTQTITLVADHGIWQSSDMRTSIGNATKDDYSIKHVMVNCPDGVAVLCYAGAGSVLVGGKYIDISDWIRQILRGRVRGLDETFIYLRERANEDLGKLLFKERIHHMFTVGSFLNGIPWVVQIRNFSTWSPTSGASAIEPQFQTCVQKIPPGNRVITYFPPLLPTEHKRLLRLSPKRPRHWKEVANLLAAINLQVAKRKRSVSSHCVVTYVPNRKDLNGIRSELHGPHGLRHFAPAFIFRGIDLTETSRLLLERDLHPAKRQEAACNSTIARNPLRPETATAAEKVIAGLATFVGQPWATAAESIDSIVSATGLCYRWLEPNTAVYPDYMPNRINVLVGAATDNALTSNLIQSFSVG
jgi:hypothetical protein